MPETETYGPIAASTAPDIQWGGVVKGALIVTGVALAAVVGYLAFSSGTVALSSTLSGMPTVNTLLGAAAQGITALASSIAHFAGIAAGYVSTQWAALPAQLGLTQGLFPAEGIAGFFRPDTAAQTMGTVGAIGVAAASVPLASQHMMTPDTNTAMIAATTAHGAGLAGGAHVAAHVAGDVANDHAVQSRFQAEQRRWTDHIAPRASAAAAIKPRDTSFTAQIEADSAALDKALGK